MNLQYLKNQQKIKELYEKKNVIALYTHRDIKINNRLKTKFINTLNKNLNNDYVVKNVSKPLIDFIINLLNINEKEYNSNKNVYNNYAREIASTLKKMNKYIFLNKFIQETFYEQDLIIRNVTFAMEDYFVRDINAIRILIAANKEDTVSVSYPNQKQYVSDKFDIVINISEDVSYERLTNRIKTLLENKNQKFNECKTKLRKRKKFNIFDLINDQKILVKENLNKKDLENYLANNVNKNLIYERCN